MSTESYYSFRGKVRNSGLQVCCCLLAEVEHHHEGSVQPVQLPDVHKDAAVVPDVAHPAAVHGELLAAQQSQRSVQSQARVGPGALDLQQSAAAGSALGSAGSTHSSLLTPTQAAGNVPVGILCWQLPLFKPVRKFHWKSAFSLHFLARVEWQSQSLLSITFPQH